MSIFESLRTSLQAIGSSKMRSALTMLGIIIGVTAVIALSSVGQGVQTMVGDTIQSLGSNLVYIMPSQPDDSVARAYLTMADAEALGDPFNAPAVAAVAPQTGGNLRVTYGGQSANLSIKGASEREESVRSLELVVGGFLTAADLEEQGRVAVLGWDAYTELFTEGEYPVDKTIYIGDSRFRVVGVLKRKGGMMVDDENIYVPITTAQARLFTARTLTGEHPVSSIAVTVIEEDLTDAAVEQIEATLRERHGISPGDEDDFRVVTQQQALDISSQVTSTLTTFLTVIAGISLLVGGIGIMNIMLVTVTERTREIGIRKAVGATKGAVLVQFLIESLVLTLLGGLVGVVLGIGSASLLSGMMGLTPEVTASTLILATGICSFVGLTFGVYPAMRAAQLHPIEALRYE
jgi:putative ABC transport system permease protein